LSRSSVDGALKKKQNQEAAKVPGGIRGGGQTSSLNFKQKPMLEGEYLPFIRVSEKQPCIQRKVSTIRKNAKGAVKDGKKSIISFSLRKNHSLPTEWVS
jgi:hypothetical protein